VVKKFHISARQVILITTVTILVITEIIVGGVLAIIPVSESRIITISIKVLGDARVEVSGVKVLGRLWRNLVAIKGNQRF
jgi:hypothetical protein